MMLQYIGIDIDIDIDNSIVRVLGGFIYDYPYVVNAKGR